MLKTGWDVITSEYEALSIFSLKVPGLITFSWNKVFKISIDLGITKSPQGLRDLPAPTGREFSADALLN